MASIFTRIINGEIPSYKIAEDDNYYAFLDISPLTEGHTLVVPKKEIDYVFELDDSTLSGLVLFSKKVALAIQQAIPCLRVGVTVMGLEVPHAHVHLIPMRSMADMNFSQPKLKLSKEEFEAIAVKIRQYL
ncbi:MAG: HIT family protein [Thermoflexibacteraceae bacterium]|jgi:histidine triad (HIT) family protein